MLGKDFEIDDKEVIKLFNDLNQKERKKVFKTAIIKSLQIVKKQTLTNLEHVIEPDKINDKDRYGNSFKSGIVTRMWKNKQGGTIHIMKNFKMKYFEIGTGKRYNEYFQGKELKKKRSTGSIKAYHYFKKAVDAKESEVFNTIQNKITEAIIRINNKHK